jgi:glycosyltransferase involved in cell wall biosynthesis
MSKPRLLHLIPSIARGGLETLVASLVPLQTESFDVDIWFTGGVPGASLLDETLRRGGAREIRPVNPPHPKAFRRGRIPRGLSGIDRYDVLHNHIHPYFYLIGAIKKAGGIQRIVSTQHTLYSYGYRPGWLKRLREARYGREVDALTAVSEAVRQSLPFLKSEVKVVPNGISPDAFPFTVRSLSGTDTFMFLCVANVVPRVKGHDILLPAFNALHAQFPHVRLVCVGYYDKAYVSGLLDQLPCRRAVTFTGSIDDVRPLLEQAKAFVLLSRTEGLPVSLLEAVMSGLPVVVSNTAGSREVLGSETAGFLVPSPDPIAASQAMKACLLDYRDALTRAAAARKHVMARHTLQTMHETYLSLYRDDHH